MGVHITTLEQRLEVGKLRGFEKVIHHLLEDLIVDRESQIFTRHSTNANPSLRIISIVSMQPSTMQYQAIVKSPPLYAEQSAKMLQHSNIKW